MDEEQIQDQTKVVTEQLPVPKEKRKVSEKQRLALISNREKSNEIRQNRRKKEELLDKIVANGHDIEELITGKKSVKPKRPKPVLARKPRKVRSDSESEDYENKVW